MEVRGVNDFRPAFVDPKLILDSLAIWAVPVPAGVMVETHMAAGITNTDVGTQAPALTGRNGINGFSLYGRRSVLFLIALAAVLKHLLDW